MEEVAKIRMALEVTARYNQSKSFFLSFTDKLFFFLYFFKLFFLLQKKDKKFRVSMLSRRGSKVNEIM